MISINPDRQISVVLSVQEQMLILKRSVAIDEWILSRVRKSRHRSRRGKLTLSQSEYECLLDAIANEIDCAKDEMQRAAFGNLYNRLADHIDEHTAEAGDQPPHKSMAGPMEGIAAFLQGQSFDSIDDANIALSKLMNTRNSQPKPEMGGLSSNQVAQLIHLAWDNPSNPIELNDQLQFSDLQGAKFFLNTRIFLQALHTSKGPNVTAKGNLNRKFVSQMLEKMQWADGYIEELFKYNKVVNEHDIFELHRIRVVCRCGGLIRKHKTSFVITKKAEKLLADEQAGALYAILFHNFFQKFNLAYLDVLPDYPGVQSTIGYSLYRLGKVAKTWKPIESMSTEILLPNVLKEIEDATPEYYELSWPIEKRLILPLEQFGLIECRHEKKAKSLYPTLAAVKITNLFSKFIRFEFDK